VRVAHDERRRMASDESRPTRRRPCCTIAMVVDDMRWIYWMAVHCSRTTSSRCKIVRSRFKLML